MPQASPNPNQLSAAQIATVAAVAGFPEEKLATAVAVALAESGGRADAAGDIALQNSTWGPSLGLWQIRSLRRDTGTGTPRDATRLKDPAFNAKAAFNISSGGTNWKPWSTYTSGRYLLYMPTAKKGVQDFKAAGGAAAQQWLQDVTPGVGSAIGGALGALGDLPGAVGDGIRQSVPSGLGSLGYAVAVILKAGAWMSQSENWLRVAKVGVGAAIIIGGLVVVARPMVPSVVDQAVKLGKKG